MNTDFSISVYSADDGEFLGSCDLPGAYPNIVITVVGAMGFEQKDIVTVKRSVGDQQIILALSDRIPIPPCKLSVFVQVPPQPQPTPQQIPSPKVEPISPQIPDITPQQPVTPQRATNLMNQAQYTFAFASSVQPNPGTSIRGARLRDVFHDSMYMVERIEAGLPLLSDEEIFFRRRAAYYLGSICANKYQPSKTERRDFMVALVGPYGFDIEQLVSSSRKRGLFDMACNNMTSSMTKNMGIQRKKRRKKDDEAGPSSKKPATGHVDEMSRLNAALIRSEVDSEERRELIAKTSAYRRSSATIDPHVMLQQYPDYLKDQSLAIYDLSQIASGVNTFSDRITGPVYDYLSVLLQLNPNKPKLEDIIATSNLPSNSDKKCHASLLMIFYFDTDQTSLERVLSPFFYNDFSHISSISNAVKMIDNLGVKVPCIVRLAEPINNPYFVVYCDVSLHVKGGFSTAVILLYAFYQTFNSEYPKSLMSMMQVVGELLGLKHSTLTSEQKRLVESVGIAPLMPLTVSPRMHSR